MVKLPGDSGLDDGWTAKVTFAEDEERQRKRLGGGNAPDLIDEWNTPDQPELKAGPTEVKPPPAAAEPPTLPAPAPAAVAKPEPSAPAPAPQRPPPEEIAAAFRKSIDEAFARDEAEKARGIAESRQREKAALIPAPQPGEHKAFDKFIENKGGRVSRGRYDLSDVKASDVMTPEERSAWAEDNKKTQVWYDQYLDRRLQQANEAVENWQRQNPGKPVPPTLLTLQKKWADFWQRKKPETKKWITEAEDIIAGRKQGAVLRGGIFGSNTWKSLAKGVASTGAAMVRGAGEARVLLGQSAGEKIEMKDSSWYAAGDAIDAYAAQLFPTDPARAREAATNIAAGFGSAISFYGTGGATAALGALARMSQAQRLMLAAASSGAFGALAGGDENVQDAYRSARKQGGPKLTNRDILFAYSLGALGGATEAAPIMSWLKAKGGFSSRTLTKMLEQALEEGGQEGFQTLLSNWAAQIIHDPKRSIWENVPESAGIGAVVGGGMQLARSGVGAVRGRSDAETAPDPAARIPEPRQDEQPQQTPPVATTPAETAPPAPVVPQEPPTAPAVNVLEPARDSGDVAENAQPVQARPVETPAAAGNEVVTPDGSMRVPVETVLIELDDLKYASGDLQPRDRSRAESEIGVRERAANLDPQLLMPQRSSDSGAPIVTADGTIISGNGRVMSIEQVYGSGQFSDNAANYRAALGPEAEGMQRPVLVRRITGELPPPELARFADLSNRSAIAEMSATERAQRDAQAAQADVMQLYQGGSFESPANRPFLKAFVERAVTPAERGRLARNGRLTKEGEDRLNAAVLAAAYGDPDTLSRMLESTDDNIKSISGAMRDVSGLMMQLKASIEAGETDPAFDISGNVADAARMISDMRLAGVRPAEMLAQQDAFDRIDPITESIVRGFYNDELTRPVSRKKMTELLTAYIEEAEGHTQEGLVPDETTPEVILDAARGRQFSANADLFAAGQGVDGGTDAGDGRGDRGQPVDGSGGQAGAEDVNINTPEFAAKFIPNEQSPKVDPDQLAFFTDLFGPDSVQDNVTDEPTDAMRAAFRELLAGTTPVRQLGKALADHPSIDGDVYGSQLDTLINDALSDGLLRRQKNGLRRTAKAKEIEVADPVADVVQAVRDVVNDLTSEDVPVDVSGINGVRELVPLLERYGINTTQFGQGEAKSLKALANEIKSGETQLFDRNGTLVRKVSSLALDVFTDVDGKRLKLYEDRQDFTDGRTRRRPLAQSIGEKLAPGEAPQESIARALKEELGVSRFTQTGEMTEDSDELSSPSYPGILSNYTTYRASVEIDPAEYRPEYIEKQAEKTNVMSWFEVTGEDVRGPNVPGSAANMARREAAARERMAEPDYAKASDPAQAFFTDKDTTFGEFWSDEWKAKRRYNIKDADGNAVEATFDEAIDYLERTAIQKAERDGGAARDRKAYILIGLAGAGKSTFADPVGTQRQAVHSSADDAKLIIPEFDGGNNSFGVHEESSKLAKAVLGRLIDNGYNIVLEKLGSSTDSIQTPAYQFMDEGYDVTLVHVRVPTAVAMERAIGRFEDTGRAVPVNTYDLNIDDVYTILKEQEGLESAQFEWIEPEGWRFTDENAPGLEGFEIRDRFTGEKIAYGGDGAAGARSLGGSNRRQELDRNDNRAQEEATSASGNLESPAQPGFLIPETEIAASSVEAHEEVTGQLTGSDMVEWASMIEESRGSVAETQAALDWITEDPTFGKAEAFELAELVGYPPNKSDTMQAALDSIVSRTQDLIDEAELSEILEPEAVDEDLFAAARGIPDDGIAGDVSLSEGIGQAAGPLERDGTSLPGDGGRSDVSVGAGAAQPGLGERGEAIQGEAGRLRGDTDADRRIGEERDRVREVVAQAEKDRADRRASNYRITEDDKIGQGSEKQKVRANIEAIKTLREIEADNRPATLEEKSKMAKFVGWGAFAQKLFDDKQDTRNAKTWAKERAELRDLLTPEEWDSAKASTLNAHFTSPEVVTGMWQAMEYLGFDGGRVLEPAAGSGNFLGMTPDGLASKIDWSAVELEEITGNLAKSIYAGSDVRVAGFETQRWPKNFFDAAISNVPFGDFSLTDKTSPEYKGLLIHDYFFVKSLDLVRPGGIVAFVTSAGTMDKQSKRARELMAKRADLIGAIRLPGGNKGAFASNAGTEVTTDILFLQKRADGQPASDVQWMDTVEIKTPEGATKINEYFASNRKMMLGQMRLQGSMYRKDSPVLIGATNNLDQKIMKAVQDGMPEGVFTRAGETVIDAVPEEVDSETFGIKEGAFYEKGGKLYRKVVGVGQPVKSTGVNGKKIKAFIRIRDAYNKLLSGQAKGELDGMDELRAELNAAHDAFVKDHGPISRVKTTVQNRTNKKGENIIVRSYPNFAPLREDPDAYKVFALEIYDEKTDKAEKSAVFSEDVLTQYERPEVTSSGDVLAVSLNERGRVDIPFIAEAMGVTEDEAVAMLGDMVFYDPAKNSYETAARYLSGDVVGKLEEATAAAETDPAFQRNVDALKDVQPTPLTRIDIRILMGAPWIDPAIYAKFFEEKMQGRNVNATLLPASKRWELSGWFNPSAATEWGHPDVTLGDIVKAAMNNTSITVTKTSGYGADKVTYTDQKATEEVQSRIDAIRDAFGGNPKKGIDGWIWEDEARAQEVEAVYNRSYNRLVAEQYDGAHLTFPGMARVLSFPGGEKGEIRLPAYRTGAIWRIVSQGNALLAHAVGAGKTFTSIMSGMEQKRLGMIQRPAYVVPNHMLEQFSTEFLQIYPNAKLLIADKDTMSKAKRKELAARVASQRWDGVIITHDAFGRIGMSEEYTVEFMKNEIREMKEMQAQAAIEGGSQSDSVKDIEKKVKRLTERLAKLMAAERKDDGMTFEEMGIDFLYVDEAHLFKNLNFNTRQTRLKGLSSRPSQRATDLFMKIQYLEKSRPGRSAVFMTGTPVSNTMAELYTMMRYLQLPTLKEYGLDNFDAWLATFGDIASEPEIAPNGREMRDTRAVRRFVNIPELMNLYGQIADVQTAAMLKLPVPKLKGGAPIIIESEFNDVEESMMQTIVARSEAVKGKKPEKGQDNILAVMTDGLKLATDVRLLDPTAEFNPNGTIAKAVENIARIYKRGEKPALSQIVFLDMGVPGGANKAQAQLQEDADEQDDSGADIETFLGGGFNLYEDLRERLIDAGIPKNEIAFIHDANNDVKKARLFEQVREGKVRVLIGTTGKMGVGTNVQKYLVAMHHIDAPWRPADLEQRDGRILRQGNKNEEIEIYRYITVNSLDAVRWQQLTKKSKFIAQLSAGARGVREAEDIDSPLPEADMVKAAATGNPAIMRHAELSSEIRELEASKRSSERATIAARQKFHEYKAVAEATNKRMARTELDAQRVTDLSGDNFAVSLDIGTKGPTIVTDRKKAGEALKTFALTYINKLGYSTNHSYLDIGQISGFNMRLGVKKVYRDRELVTVATASIEGEDVYNNGAREFVLTDETNPVSLMQRFENLVKGVPVVLADYQKRVADIEAELPRFQAQSSMKPFAQQDQLDAAKAELEQIEISLNPDRQRKIKEEEARRAAEAVATGNPELETVDALMDDIGSISSDAERALESLVGPEAKDDIVGAIRGWHGAASKFDRFDLGRYSKTGEGVHAFGYGVYIAENQLTGETYKNDLALKDGMNRLSNESRDFLLANGDVDSAITIARGRVDAGETGYEKIANELIKWRSVGSDQGYLYELDIDVDKDQLADWDQLLVDAPAHVRQAFAELGVKFGPGLPAKVRTVGRAYEILSYDLAPYGERTSQKAVSDALLEKGIPGLKYLDAGSRDKGEGTYNFVIFDDALINVLSRNGEPVTQQERDEVLAKIKSIDGGRQAGTHEFSRAFQDAMPTWASQVLAEARRILPPAVHIQLRDAIVRDGKVFDATYYPSRKILELAMDTSATRAIEVARHEAIHVARLMRLFRPREWNLLKERAQKLGLYESQPHRNAYRAMYRRQGIEMGHRGRKLDRFVQELMDQEAVARLAEQWATGAQHGKRVDGLFARIRDFFQAMVNAARGLGFDTADKVFDRFLSGEVARRGGPAISETAVGQGILAAYGMATSEAIETRDWSDDVGGVQTRYDESGLRVRTYGNAMGTASIAEQNDGTWSLQVAESPDIDSLHALISQIEMDTGQYMAADGWLTQEQYEYYSEQDPELVAGHRQAGPLFNGMWVSPGQVTAAIDSLTDVASSGDRTIARKLQELHAIRNTMPPDMVGAMRHSLAAGSNALASRDPSQPGDMGMDRPDQSLTDLVRKFNEYVLEGGRVRGSRMPVQKLGRLPRSMKRAAARNNGWLAGVYNRMTGVTRIEIPNDFVTLTHEGGHALEEKASTRSAIQALKQRHAQDLLLPPMPDHQPAPFPPGQVYSGVELDDHAMGALLEHYQAAMQQRALQRRQQSGYQVDAFTLEDNRVTAETSMAVLTRRLGPTTAQMVVADLMATGLPPANIGQYANTRFARTGEAQPRAQITVDAERLSEAWGDWFSDYLIDPDKAKAHAPELFLELADEIEGIDPAMLEVLEEIQDGYQALMLASPVSAMRSRVKSAFARGRREEAIERYNERKKRGIAMDKGGIAARGAAAKETLGEELASYSYSAIEGYVDNKHPMKVAVRTLIDIGVANGKLTLEQGKKAFLKVASNPYKLWRLATHTKTHAVATILYGPAIHGDIDGVGPSVRDAMVTAFGGDSAQDFSLENQELFGTYLITRRLLAEWERYDREEIPNPPDQLMSRSRLWEARQEIELKHPRFAEGAEMLYTFQNNYLQYLYEQGFISEKDRDTYQARKDYVPLNRIMDRFGMINAAKRYSGVNKGRVMYRFLGSNRDFINPLESIIQGVFNFQERAETNAVVGKMLDLAEWAGEGGGAIAERIDPTDYEAVKVRFSDVIKPGTRLRNAMRKGGEFDKSTLDMATDDLRLELREAAALISKAYGASNDDLGGILNEIDSMFDGEATATIFRPVMAKENPNERIMYVYRDGQRIPVLLGDNQIARDIYEQFAVFGKENTNFVMQTMVAGAQILRAGVTKAPAYIYNNFFRDQVQVGSYTRDYVPFKTGLKGLKDVWRDTAASQRYTRFSGLMGGVDSNIMNLGNQKFGVGAFRKSGFWAVPGQWSIAQGWNTFLRAMEITEAGSRVGHFDAAFKRALADNMSPEEAAYEAAYAADDVMPFGRLGSKMKTLTRITHFANAGIQGLSATNRTMLGERDMAGETWRPEPFDPANSMEDEPFIKALAGDSLTGEERKNLPNSARIWIAMAGLGLVSLALKIWYDDEPEEDEANDYRSSTHWRFRLSGIKPFVPEEWRDSVPEWFYFPKPFDIAVVSNLVESAYDTAVSGDATGPERFWKSLEHTVVPPHEVNAVALYYEMKSGKDFFSKRDIVPERLAGLDNRYQYDAYTSEIAKLMGKYTNLSPKEIDHVVRRLGGTWGRDLSTASNWIIPPIKEAMGGNVIPRAETPIEDTIILGRNFGRASQGSRSVDYFWRNMKANGGEFTKVATTYKKLKDLGLTNPATAIEARKYIASLPPEKRAYAIIEGDFQEKQQDLNPMNRAKQVAAITSNIRTAMTDGTLIREATKKRGKTDRDVVDLDPKTRMRVKVLLEKINMREVHNAMVLSEVPGWKQRQIWDVKPLVEELRKLSPAVADEYKERMYETGRNQVYSFEAVKKYWPEARKRLLKDGAAADLSDLVGDAKAETLNDRR